MPQNQDIAQRLREVAQFLEDQGANRFRMQAYRAAADNKTGRATHRIARPVSFGTASSDEESAATHFALRL